MSRPTTARPKTSAGNRATSARGFRRPSSTAHQYGDERVQSRAGIIADVPVSERLASRAGVVSQSGTMGKREPSRIGTSFSRLTTASIINVPPHTDIRPVTKQGLVGVRPTSRAATALNRQVLDKTYYMSLLRAKMNSLITEIENLKREVEKGERDKQDSINLEKKAEEEAENLQELHGQLIDLNVVINHLHENVESKVLEEEYETLKQQNDRIEDEANELFAERKEKEAEIANLNQKIESSKAAAEAFQNNMDPKLRDEIEQLRGDLEQVNDAYRLLNDELLNLTAKKDSLDEELANSPLKRQALELREQLVELEAKKEAVQNEINEVMSPEQKRQELLASVKKLSKEIEVIEQQTETVNQKIAQCNEELREFDTEFEETIGEKSAKYQEFKLAEMQYDEFLNQYDDRKKELEDSIASLQETVLELLTLISLNCEQIDNAGDVTEMDISSLDQANNVVLSAIELQDLHVRLQEEMITLKEKEENIKIEVANLRQRIDEIEQKMQTFDDVDEIKKRVDEKRTDLEERQKALEKLIPDAEKELAVFVAELSSINDALNNNNDYHKLQKSEKEFQMLDQRRNRMKEELAKRKAKTDYQTIKQQVMELREKYNQLLLEQLKS